MGKTVKSPCCHLPFGHAECIRRIHQRKPGIAYRIIVPCLYFFLFVGYDCCAVTFTSCPCQCGDHPHGNESKINDPLPLPIIHPRVFSAARRKRNRFAAVHDRAAAHSENELYTAAPCQPGSFQHFPIGGIGHDSGKFHHSFSGFHQKSRHFVIDSISLD